MRTSRIFNSGIATVKKDILGLRKLPTDIKSSWRYGKRLSHIKGQNTAKTIGTRSYSIVKKGFVPHLPGIMAAIASVVPVVGSTAGGFALGKYIRKIILKK